MYEPAADGSYEAEGLTRPYVNGTHELFQRAQFNWEYMKFAACSLETL